jgi:hypothetical protein
MAGDRNMLMVLHDDDGPRGPSIWVALRIDGKAALTLGEVEEVLVHVPVPKRRFLLPYTEQTAHFGGDGVGVMPTLALPPGQTLWSCGEPTRTDSIDVLKTVLDGAESPEPNAALLPLASVLREATERFGEADVHDVETHFDRLVLSLDGSRAGEPPAYLVRIDRILQVPRF